MVPVILALSPGARSTGLVIMRDRQIINVEVRQTRGEWRHRRTPFMEWIEATIEKYRVGMVVMKVVASEHCSDTLQSLYAEIRHLARRREIHLSEYQTKCLKKHLLIDIPNRASLFQHVALVFPELRVHYHKDRNLRSPFYTRVFEAAACALVHSRVKAQTAIL